MHVNHTRPQRLKPRDDVQQYSSPNQRLSMSSCSRLFATLLQRQVPQIVFAGYVYLQPCDWAHTKSHNTCNIPACRLVQPKLALISSGVTVGRCSLITDARTL